MSLFGVKLEDNAGLDDTGLDAAAPGAMDESETVTAEVSELQQESADIDADGVEADQVESNIDLIEDQAEVVEEVVQEGRGLTAAEAMVIATTMRYCAGPKFKHNVASNIKLENMAGASGRLEQSKLILEDLKSNLKAAWEYIKKTFNKIVNKIKSVIVKAFDTAKKLAKRATAARNKAESAVGTKDKNKISFGGASISTDGKLTPADVNTQVNSLETIVKAVYKTVNSDKVGDTANTFAEVLKGKDSPEKLKSDALVILNGLKSAIGSYNAGSGNGAIEKGVVDNFGTDVNVIGSSALPGNKAVAIVTGSGNNSTLAEVTANVRRCRVTLVTTKNKVRDFSGEVEPLTPSQAASICDKVADYANILSDYKRGWETRDKDHATIVKTLDDFFKDVKSNTDNETSEQERNARSVASAATGYIRRDTNFRSSFMSYAIAVGNTVVSYAEASVRNLK